MLTPNYQKALDYVLSIEEIDSVMVGFGNESEIDDMVNYLSGSMDSGYNPPVAHKKIHVNHEDCMGCGACMESCASGALFYDTNGLAQVDHTKCITCGYCSYACPYRAIIMY